MKRKSTYYVHFVIHNKRHHSQKKGSGRCIQLNIKTMIRTLYKCFLGCCLFGAPELVGCM